MQENIPDFVIDLKKRDSFKPRIEEDNAFRISSYRPIYCQALDLARRVVENTKELQTKPQRSDGVGKDSPLDAFQGGFDYNNIIAFTGGRGSGKTSLMLSFQKMLANGPGNANFDFQEGDPLEGFQWPKFKAVEPIDPAAFEHKERIIEIFISRLYHDFAKEIDRRGGQASDRGLIGKILESFRKVLDGIRLLRDPGMAFKDDTSGMDRLLDQLDRLGTAPSLQKSIRELVDSYLEFMLEDKDKQSFLLIAIDDADLNLVNSVQLLEDLRKYLRQPRLLILVAMRQDQILANLSKEFHQQYKDLNDRHRFDDPRNLADAYLRKLIPDTARVMMPFSDLRTKARRVRIKVSGFGGIDSNEKDARSRYPTLFSYLQQIMRRKLAFTLSDSLYNGEHPFVPDSLRELYDMVNELSEWRDFVPDYPFSPGPSGHRNITRWIGGYTNNPFDEPTFNNHRRFIDYLIQTWSVGKIGLSLKTFLIELSNKDAGEINKFIVSGTMSVVSAHFEASETQRDRQRSQLWDPIRTPLEVPRNRNYASQNFKTFEEVFSQRSNPEQVALGEVMFLLRLVQENFVNEEIARFIFAVRAIYSMKAMGELFSKENRWGVFPGLATMIGDMPFTPEIYQIATPNYVGKPGKERFYIKHNDFERLAKKFNQFWKSYESGSDNDDATSFKIAYQGPGTTRSERLAEVEELGLIRSWDALHYFLFWGGEKNEQPRHLKPRGAFRYRLDNRYLTAKEVAGQVPESTKGYLCFSFDHVFRSILQPEVDTLQRIFPEKDEEKVWPFIAAQPNKPEIESLIASKSAFTQWQWGGLPNFPIWDLEGLQEIMDQFFEKFRIDSLVGLAANEPLRLPLVASEPSAGEAEEAPKVAYSRDDFMHHTFLLLRKFLEEWDEIIDNYGSEMIDASKYINRNTESPYPLSLNRLSFCLFRNHPLLKFVRSYLTERIGGFEKIAYANAEPHTKRGLEKFWFKRFFNQFILELVDQEDAVVLFGPAKLNKDTIPNIKWLLESRSKSTGYEYHFNLAINNVRDNSFPENLDREGKLATLRAIFQEFKNNNAKSKLNADQRRSYGRRFLDILQSLAVE